MMIIKNLINYHNVKYETKSLVRNLTKLDCIIEKLNLLISKWDIETRRIAVPLFDDGSIHIAKHVEDMRNDERLIIDWNDQ